MRTGGRQVKKNLKLKARDAKENPAKILAAVLFVMYIVSGLLLLLLAFLLYKMELGESVIKIAVIAIYVVTGMLGGVMAGKKIKDKKFLWGLAAGALYFAVLYIVSFAVKRGADPEPVKAATTLILCACAGMAGGMIS